MTGHIGDDFDVIVVGTGVAGLSVAASLAMSRRVAVITSGALGGGSTALAQGGIAAAIDPSDSPRLHASDTVAAGGGLCDADVVRGITDDAPDRIRDLIDLGTRFDRTDAGELALTREGGHRCLRVAHAGGDATGAEVSRALVATLRTTAAAVFDYTTVIDLHLAIGRHGRQVGGVVVRRGESVGEELLTAREVVLATGGIGSLYVASTNPPEVAGDGLALALRAGAALVDVEFVQFHPTGLRVPGRQRVPLISEALRGEGAVLRDRQGHRIMAGHHPMADLAPRDIVARRIDAVMSEPLDGEPNVVGLDVTGFEPGVMTRRFPTAAEICRRYRIDPATEWIPVAPTQHFLCGGIRTDAWGRSDVAGLSAVGEVAATGLHGANRLASNSMLEGVAVGRRVADRLGSEVPARASREAPPPPALPRVGWDTVSTMQTVMSRYAGVVRSGAGLTAALASLNAVADSDETAPLAAHRWLASYAVVAAASAREESRGCHWRADFPAADDAWRHRLLVSLNEAGLPEVAAAIALEETA